MNHFSLLFRASSTVIASYSCILYCNANCIFIAQTENIIRCRIDWNSDNNVKGRLYKLFQCTINAMYKHTWRMEHHERAVCNDHINYPQWLFSKGLCILIWLRWLQVYIICRLRILIAAIHQDKRKITLKAVQNNNIMCECSRWKKQYLEKQICMYAWMNSMAHQETTDYYQPAWIETGRLKLFSRCPLLCHVNHVRFQGAETGAELCYKTKKVCSLKHVTICAHCDILGILIYFFPT